MSDGDAAGPSPYLGYVSAETQTARKQFAAAAERNTDPILSVLAEIVPDRGRALEIASGTGQHIVAFAAAFPGILWQPSDPNAEARSSIAAWIADSGCGNLAAPLDLDVTRPGWAGAAGGSCELILCINMVHISPWAACLGLMAGAGALLKPGGALYLYGPYRRDGEHTAPSNEAFDQALRRRDPQWGLRDMADVAAAAAAEGLGWERSVPMPANNFSLVFRRADG